MKSWLKRGLRQPHRKGFARDQRFDWTCGHNAPSGCLICQTNLARKSTIMVALLDSCFEALRTGHLTPEQRRHVADHLARRLNRTLGAG